MGKARRTKAKISNLIENPKFEMRYGLKWGHYKGRKTNLLLVVGTFNHVNNGEEVPNWM